MVVYQVNTRLDSDKMLQNVIYVKKLLLNSLLTGKAYLEPPLLVVWHYQHLPLNFSKVNLKKGLKFSSRGHLKKRILSWSERVFRYVTLSGKSISIRFGVMIMGSISIELKAEIRESQKP